MVFNGPYPMTDLLFTRANRYISGNNCTIYKYFYLIEECVIVV